MEDNLKTLAIENDKYFFHMEDDLNILANRRQNHYFGIWKMTSIFWQMEDDLNILKLEEIFASPSFY